MAQARRTAVLHYTAPPVVGGVEAVIYWHARIFAEHDRPLTVIAGRGRAAALPDGTRLVLEPLLDSQHPEILAVSADLEKGVVPAEFDVLVERLASRLAPVLAGCEHVILHNVLTKHFNLPLTAALVRLLDRGQMRGCIGWCHDFTWTSRSSRSKVHPGHPWDLLRTPHPNVTYVVVSHQRQVELARLFGVALEQVHVVYNGVDPAGLLGLSVEGRQLLERLGFLAADLAVLLPVRITRAKNMELALQAAAALKKRGLRVRMVVTGPPDPHSEDAQSYFRQLLQLRRDLGVEDELRFVYESGKPGEGYIIDADIVSELLRLSDLVFLPSHYEGFGMPVLEAGLLGIPVFATPVPAAEEIGSGLVEVFQPDEDPGGLAQRLLQRVESSPTYRFRRLVRQEYTWEAIFQKSILPLLTGGAER